MGERKGGWYDFAGAMFGIAGTFNSIQGLSAVIKKEYFAGGTLVYDTSSSGDGSGWSSASCK